MNNTQNTQILPVGTRVRSWMASWGEGTIVKVNDSGERTASGERIKPYVVRRDDGTLGYFHFDQVMEA